MSQPTVYPLSWPAHFTRATSRESGRFTTKLPAAINNVKNSLRLFATDSGRRLENVVISSNASLGDNRPADPGVSVWFTWDGLQVCIPVDRYQTVEANLQAIHLILESRRIELRHGTLALVRATFTGFLSLAAPSTTTKSWRDVMEVPQETRLADVRRKYKHLATQRHPDKPGGSSEAMTELNAAMAAAEKELG